MADQSCRYCGEPIWTAEQPSRPWLLLNRYGVGTGKHRSLVEAVEDGECVWDISSDDGEDYCSGTVVHWPECATAWIEGKMVEADFDGRRLFGNG